jgi:hypothetical protein
MSPTVQAALALADDKETYVDLVTLAESAPDSRTISRTASATLAAEVRRLERLNTKMADEMTRYLPVIECAENMPSTWEMLTRDTGIATANGYRAAIAAMKGTT